MTRGYPKLSECFFFSLSCLHFYFCITSCAYACRAVHLHISFFPRLFMHRDRLIETKLSIFVLRPGFGGKVGGRLCFFFSFFSLFLSGRCLWRCKTCIRYACGTKWGGGWRHFGRGRGRWGSMCRILGLYGVLNRE